MGGFAGGFLDLFLGVIALVHIVCFLVVLVKMFQHDYTVMAVICFLLGCAGIGGLIAFVFGWTKAQEWRMTTPMTVWSFAWIALIAFYGGTALMNIRA